MTTHELNVNSVKLTPKYRIGKRERKILILVGNGFKGEDVLIFGRIGKSPDYYPNEGCNMRFLVENLFGAVGIESSIDCDRMEAKPKVIISRALRSLYLKGLLKMGTLPTRGRKKWMKSEENIPGFYGTLISTEKFVSLTFNEWVGTDLHVETIRLESSTFYSELPTNTKKWWMLTDAGKNLVNSWEVLDTTPQAGSSKDGG